MPRDLSPGQDGTAQLRVRIGQATRTGPKPLNQDFHGALVPTGAMLALKGITLALADGISPSPVSHIAAETAVRALMSDYYATSDAETVRTAASRVIAATNGWLAAQSLHAGERDPDRGHVCTLSALILKGRQAHLFHVGDSRIWRLAGRTLEPLTTDHRIVLGQQSMLGRAMGLGPAVEIDCRSLPLGVGDTFVLTTDGTHEAWDVRAVAARLAAGGDPQADAEAILEAALAAGARDNLTIQIVRIEALPPAAGAEALAEGAGLPLLPAPAPGAVVDGWRVLRALHQNARSHVFIAEDAEGRQAVLKFPASDLRQDRAALGRMMLEEWIARRVSSPHLLSAPPSRARSGLYTVTDLVPGENLRQWMHDHPQAELADMRAIATQIAAGLQALHRREMLHQDLRPENVMIDAGGHVRIIDFGSALVAGVEEAGPEAAMPILGTLQYTAPEYFAGAAADWRADLFSLATILYEMLTGRLPYGAAVSRIRSPADRARLVYRPARETRPALPDWLDAALARALHPDPARRHETLSEFLSDLARPSAGYLARRRPPLIERDPLRFWKLLSAALALTVVALAGALLT